METIRVGLIGTGGFARFRTGNLLKVPGVTVTALADTNAGNMASIKAAHPAIQSAAEYEDYRALLDARDVDAVMIMTPHTQHVTQILESLAAGKHTCVEKPMVTTVKDAKAVIAARDSAKKVGMVSYQRKFQAEFRKVREIIQSGEAGPVQFVAGLNCQEWKKGTAGTWRQIPELSGGGQLNDTGSHFVDILLWAPALQADIVSAIGDNRGTPVDIDSSVTIRFKGGAVGSISIIGDATNWHEDITIMCEKMGFFIRDGKLTVRNLQRDKVVYQELNGGTTPDAHFISCIRDGIACESPFESGLDVIRLTEAAWKSMAAGGAPIRVDELG